MWKGARYIHRRASRPASWISLLAFTLFFSSFVGASPSELLEDTRVLIGNAVVGMSAAVEPNPYNTLAGQLNEKEQELLSREELLQKEEERLREEQKQLVSSMDLSTYSFISSIVLFVLLAVNFAWDWKRNRTTLVTNVAASKTAQKVKVEIPLRR